PEDYIGPPKLKVPTERVHGVSYQTLPIEFFTSKTKLRCFVNFVVGVEPLVLVCVRRGPLDRPQWTEHDTRRKPKRSLHSKLHRSPSLTGRISLQTLKRFTPQAGAEYTRTPAMSSEKASGVCEGFKAVLKRRSLTFQRMFSPLFYGCEPTIRVVATAIHPWRFMRTPLGWDEQNLMSCLL